MLHTLMADLDVHKNPRSNPTMTAASVLPVYALHLNVVNGPLGLSLIFSAGEIRSSHLLPVL